MRFSQRIGKKPVKTIFQIDDIDIELRTRLWNLFLGGYNSYSDHYQQISFFKSIWKDFYNISMSEMPQSQSGVSPLYCLERVRKWFFAAEWYEVYDFVEFLVSNHEYRFKADLYNEVLRLEVSAYRIVDKLVVRVNSEEEIQSIEEAISSTDHYKSVNTHLHAALNFLSDRTEPDYRNSIKESISAVEAFCKIIAEDDKATLGTAVAIIERKHKLHGSLKTAIKGLYGYTSDAGGIRHSLLENDADIDFEDAKFMLVSCTAFINFLKGKVIL